MNINYHQKKFRPANQSSNSETSSNTIFEYFQKDRMIWANYSGGGISKGHLIGTVDEQGVIDMRYHHINTEGQLMTGVCTSTPEIMANGKIRLHEVWQWTCGDGSRGTSVLEEID